MTESFQGVKGDYIDLNETNSLPYVLGGEYLVFADPCGWEPDSTGCLTTLPCYYHRSLKRATAILEQLRAKKNGKKVAAVYGMLMLWPNAALGRLGDYESRPLPNMLVRLQSRGMSFDTKTDGFGAYAFDQLPPGNYQVSVDLPPNSVLAGLIGHDLVTSFLLPWCSCFENDLYALPTGRISGRVVGPDGNPLRDATVDLYPASRYQEGKRGILGWQGRNTPSDEWKPFEFNHLPAGDYLLVFNAADEEHPDAPFSTTFYPHAASLESAQRIHLSAGQQIQNADIGVSNPLPTRQITVRLDWAGRNPEAYSQPWVYAMATRGTNPLPFKKDRDTYTFNLLLSARYTIHAAASCSIGTKGRGATTTGEATVDGSNPSLSEIALKFDSGPATCE
ncbi:MAG: hypothetical protein ACLQGV_12060 [Bryobacteraceae bacterium]